METPERRQLTKLSATARAIAALVLLLGFVAYLCLVDLGVNAGRVHYGVHVEGIELGGKSFTEAVAILRERGREEQDRLMPYRIGDYECPFTPGDVGWGPQPHDTAEAAMAVGRPIASIGSIGERIEAWVSGIRVGWTDRADPDKLKVVIDRCHREADAEDLPTDDAQVRALLGRFLFDG